MSFKNAIQAMPMSTFASSTLTGSYQAVNAAGFPYEMLTQAILNHGSTTITISFDGVNDHYVLLTLGTWSLSSNSISSQTPDPVKIPKGRIIYIKGTAGTGNIYLTGTYVATN